ncbi:S49 family peptidase [Nitratidesulfovibrio vulgaris]|nr:S49 family peptidase [Nitratidesulfovibrio vulgaris]
MPKMPQPQTRKPADEAAAPMQLLAGPLAIMPEALREHVARFASGADSAAMSFADLLRDRDDRPYELHGDVAVVNMRGTLTKRGSWWTTGMEGVRTTVQQALDDPAVRAVLLAIDSPGGTVDGTRELADWIAARVADGGKPIASYADGTMCSAAYWIGGSTGRVFAPAAALVGSVGVLWMHYDWSQYLETNGIRATYITAGSRKAAGAPEAPLSDNDKAYFQHLIDTAYTQFLDGVSAPMGLDRANPAAWADGQVFRATEALALGLVTAIVPDLAGAVAALSQEVHMDAKELAAKYPEAVAAIRKEGEENARTAASKETAQAAQSVSAIVTLVCGPEAAAKVAELAALNLSTEQIASLASMNVLQVATTSKGDEATTTTAAQDSPSQKAILEGLMQAGATPLSTQQKTEAKGDRYAALIEQSKAIAKG